MHHTSQLISTKAQRFLIFIKKSLKGFVKLYLFWRFDDVKTLRIGPIRFLSAPIHYLPDGLLRFPKIPYLSADFWFLKCKFALPVFQVRPVPVSRQKVRANRLAGRSKVPANCPCVYPCKTATHNTAQN